MTIAMIVARPLWAASARYRTTTAGPIRKTTVTGSGSPWHPDSVPMNGFEMTVLLGVLLVAAFVLTLRSHLGRHNAMVRELKRRWWWWRWRRRTCFDGRLAHELRIPAGPDGRPGERLLAHSASMYEPRMCPDDSREDFRVFVGRESTFAAVCLGRVGERGEPLESARRSIYGISAWPGTESAAIAHEEIAGEPAQRYRVILNSGALTEWKFAHDGWLFVAGVFSRSRDDEAETVRRSQAVLSTWRWLRTDEDGRPA